MQKKIIIKILMKLKNALVQMNVRGMLTFYYHSCYLYVSPIVLSAIWGTHIHQRLSSWGAFIDQKLVNQRLVLLNISKYCEPLFAVSFEDKIVLVYFQNKRGYLDILRLQSSYWSIKSEICQWKLLFLNTFYLV